MPMHLNWKRILVGGLVAGLVINVLDTASNFAVFGHRWGLAYDAIHVDVTAVFTKWARDKCLKYFHRYHVTLERVRGQTIWGGLKV